MKRRKLKQVLQRCGIFPFNPEKVLSQLQIETVENGNAEDANSLVDDSFNKLLKELHYGSEETKTKKVKEQSACHSE